MFFPLYIIEICVFGLFVITAVFLKIFRKMYRKENLEACFDYRRVKGTVKSCDFCTKPAVHSLRLKSLFELEDLLIPDNRITFCCRDCFATAKRSMRRVVEIEPESAELKELFREVENLQRQMD